MMSASELELLALRYLGDGDLSDADRADFESRLETDPAAQNALVRMTALTLIGVDAPETPPIVRPTRSPAPVRTPWLIACGLLLTFGLGWLLASLLPGTTPVVDGVATDDRSATGERHASAEREQLLLGWRESSEWVTEPDADASHAAELVPDENEPAVAQADRDSLDVPSWMFAAVAKPDRETTPAPAPDPLEDELDDETEVL